MPAFADSDRPRPPSVAELIAAMHVVSVPMRVRFRGVTRREVALIEGPAGWGEFGPFLEYAPVESARWLAAAVEAAGEGPPPGLRTSVAVHATVPAVGPERVGAVPAEEYGDIEWRVDQARDALRRLSAYGLDYAEQPCASVEELAELRRSLARDGTDVPVAADESIRRAEDPLRVRDLRAADVIVVKVAPLGGIRAALDIVAECGLPAVVSSALETSVGIAAGVALAAALPGPAYANGLGTVALLGDDVTADPMLPEDGRLPVRAVTPDPELLERLAAPPDRRRWWAQRLEASAAYL